MQDDELEEAYRAIPMVNTDLLPTNSSTESIPCISCGAYSTLVDEEGICAACVLHSYSKVWTNSSNTIPANIETENPFDPEQSLAPSQWQSIPTPSISSASVAASANPILDAATVQSRRPACTQMFFRCLNACDYEHGWKRQSQNGYSDKEEPVPEVDYEDDDDNDDVEQKNHVDFANLLV